MVGLAFLGWVNKFNDSLGLEEGWSHNSSGISIDFVGGLFGGLSELGTDWWEVECLLMGSEISELLVEGCNVDVKSDMAVFEA